MPVCRDFQRRRQHSATTAHRALPVCEWPALGMPWGTSRSVVASAVLRRCVGASTRGCGRAGHVVYWFCQFNCGIARGGGSTRQPQRTEPCQCVSGQPWACHGALQVEMQPVLCAAGVVGPELGAAAGVLCRWFVGVAVLPVCRAVQKRRQHSATIVHGALPVGEWPALGMPWATASSSAASAVSSRRGGACTGGLRQGWAGGLWGLRVCWVVEFYS